MIFAACGSPVADDLSARVFAFWRIGGTRAVMTAPGANIRAEESPRLAIFKDDVSPVRQN